MKHWKKTISVILALFMMITVLTMAVSAAPEEDLDLTFNMLDDYTLEIVGLPTSLKNPTADLYTSERVGSKRILTYLAEDAAIVDGAMELNTDEKLVFEKEYTIEIFDGSDIYCETTFTLTEQEEVPDVPKFADVSDSEWYANFVYYCVSKGLVSGMGNNRFNPNSAVTRAQVAQTLYALEGKPQVSKTGNFPDVPNGKWYSDAVNWAANSGVMNGYTTGNFQPNLQITRQQFMATLYKYVKLKNYDAVRSGDISSFSDVGSVTEYAVPALQWAVGHGVMKGTDDGKLLPKAPTSRAQMAAILASFDRNIVK